MKTVGRTLTLAGPSYVEDLAEHQRDSAIDVLNSFHAKAASFNEALSSAHADTKLTPEGRAASAAKIAAAVLEELGVAETTTLKPLVDRAAAIEQSLRARAAYTPPTNAAERSAQEQQLREIRDALRGLSASERLNVYRSTTDPLVLAAIETAPMTLSENRSRLEPFIDPAERAAAMLARAEAADPTSATTLRELQSLAEVYRLALGSVRREILDEVPGGAEDAALTIA